MGGGEGKGSFLPFLFPSSPHSLGADPLAALAVAFIDTEGTFRPDRVKSIAERFGVDPQAALENVVGASSAFSLSRYARARVKKLNRMWRWQSRGRTTRSTVSLAFPASTLSLD